MNGLKNKSDSDLVKMTLSGNNKAFEELVIRYESKVKGTAYKVTENKFSAEDASQDAFVCAWVKLNRLRDTEKFGSWVCAIAKNCAVNLLRNYRNISSEVSFGLLENIDLDDKNAEISEFLEQERKDILHETVESLSEKIRETIKQHYFDGMSTEEIAKEQNISVGTVKWRLSEGRRTLRKEYGVMENSNNTTFAQKVMYQVEQLKLWSLKNDKTGFEKEYRQVLKNIEGLQEGTQKQYMLAEVLARGYWWLEVESNDKMFNRIKSAAEEGLNENIMSFVISREWRECKDGDRIGYMENVQLPRLIQKGFKDALGYFYFWLAYECCYQGKPEKGIGYYKKVLETLNKSDELYAAASGAVHIEERKLREGITPHLLGAHGEVFEYKDNKLYLMNMPGYCSGEPMTSEIFWNSVYCDNLMFDSKSLTILYNSDSHDRIIFDSCLKEGESLTSSDGRRKLTCKSKKEMVETPSGKYENCICYVSEGEYCGTKYCETYFCQGVGIVKQIIGSNSEEWQLAKCRIYDGDEIIPFDEGNRWEYCLVQDTDKKFETENVFEIVFSEGGKAVFQSYTYVKAI